MEHICYLDKKTADLANLVSGKKTMIIRGVKYRSAPYECVFPGDCIYFSQGKDNIVLRAVVKTVKNITEPSPHELREILKNNEKALMLEPVRYKKLERYSYFSLMELGPVEHAASLEIDVVIYKAEGFWLIIGETNRDSSFS